jgi:pyrimidine operon attenuation protein/uracil phosphoribosyltransferase
VTVPTPADLGVVLTDTASTSTGTAEADRTDAPLVPLADLVRVALRRNPKRAHLLVSTVLAKHVPTVPALALAAGETLGARVADVLDGGHRLDEHAVDRLTTVLRDARTARPRPVDEHDAAVPSDEDAVHRAATALRTDLAVHRPDAPDVLVLGFAETATALGAMVAETLGARYLHSTRHDPVGATAAAGFDEAHSHATAHRLLPADDDLLPQDGTVVLVDDELSTGATARATIRELHALAPQTRWVVAALVDLRGAADVDATDDLATELGVPVTVVALGRGAVALPEGLAQAAAEVVTGHATDVTDAQGVPSASRPGVVTTVRAAPTGVDRFGVPARLVRQPRTDVEGLAADLRATLGDEPGRVLVLGAEEHMHTPLAVADALRRTGVDATFSTTTRSPIAVLDDPAWPVRSGVRFRSRERTVDGPGDRFAYNVRGFDAIVVLPEPGTDRALLDGDDGLLAALAAVTARVVLVEAPLVGAPAAGSRGGGDATVGAPSPAGPRPLTGPSFGSYEPDDVTWLLQHLADVALEADTADRERAIQLEGANYAESLPVEYVPSEAYERLYEDALERSADRIAEAVGVVTELVLRDRDRPVLVSLARAGTPIGILMRRWAHRQHGVLLPHLTASIVRGVGIDETALRWLAAHHDPADVVFVDGWTGKGAITRELTAALDRFAETDGVRFRDDLAVLADPAGCTALHGTRDDYLVPSACLNSTVSGLVSRTVFNRAITPLGTLHGAKQYRHLGARDHSRAFVAAIEARFDAALPRVAVALAASSAEDRAVDWRGMRTVEAIGAEYGIEDLHLVKPGVGETTRVLLRRVPWQVLVRDPSDVDVAHVVALARERGVPVVTRPDLAYSCIGLIHPLGGRATETMRADTETVTS